MNASDVFKRDFIEVFSINPEVKKLNKKELLKLLNQLFAEKYQGRTVTYEMLEQELFVKTTSKTRRHFGFKTQKTSQKGHLTKLRIGASGDYIKLISNVEYLRSFEDKKPDQNAMHQDTEAWHYFTKYIICDDSYYRVKVDVNESKKKEYFVYSVSLEPTTHKDFVQSRFEEKNKRDIIHSAPKLTDLRDDISHKVIIPEDNQNVNNSDEKILRKAALEDTLKECLKISRDIDNSCDKEDFKVER